MYFLSLLGQCHQYICSQNVRMNGDKSKYIKITEEPLSHGYRFRYENEARLPSRIRGEKHKDEPNTYPQIRVSSFIFTLHACT